MGIESDGASVIGGVDAKHCTILNQSWNMLRMSIVKVRVCVECNHLRRLDRLELRPTMTGQLISDGHGELVAGE